MDWLDLLVVQRTLKSLLQHHSSKESILQPSAFFTVQLSHLYMTTGIILRILHQSVEYSHNYNNLVIYYIFLPATADKSSLTVWFTSDADVMCGETKLISGESTDAFANGNSFTLTCGDAS